MSETWVQKTFCVVPPLTGEKKQPWWDLIVYTMRPPGRAAEEPWPLHFGEISAFFQV